MSVGRGIVRNIGLLLTGKAAAALLSLVTLIIVTRALGPRDFGVLVLVQGFTVGISGIVAFSGWHAIVRYGAQAIERGDTARFVRLARFMTLVEIGCALLAMATVVILAPIAGPRLGWPPEIVPLGQLYAVAVLANVLTTPNGILQLGGRFDRLGVHPVIQSAVRLAGVLIVWANDGGLDDYLIAWMVGAVCEGVFMWLLAWPVFNRLRTGEPLLGPVAAARRENQGLVRFIATTNADITLRDLAPKLVPLIVGAMLGPVAAGLYSLAQRAAILVQQPAILLSQAGFPVIAKLLAGGDRAAAIRMTWRTSAIALAVMMPVVIVLAFFSRQILELLGGREFGGGALVFVLLAIGRAAQLGAVPFASALIAMGRSGRSILVNIATNLGLLPLLPLLLLADGIEGAGWHGLLLGLTSLILLALAFRTGAREGAPIEAIDERQGLTDG